MKSFLMINTLFKTIEYKLMASGNLEVTEISALHSHQSKTFSLNSLSVEEDQSTPSSLSRLVLVLACVAIAAAIYFSHSSIFLSDNLLSTISFLICSFGALALISRPVKSQIYRDAFSNKILFKLNHHSANNNTTMKFINDLNQAINDANETESSDTDLRVNVQLQYETHIQNINDLLNLGLIDEQLHKRIRNSMREKIFGEPKPVIEDNIIYLNK